MINLVSKTDYSFFYKLVVLAPILWSSFPLFNAHIKLLYYGPKLRKVAILYTTHLKRNKHPKFLIKNCEFWLNLENPTEVFNFAIFNHSNINKTQTLWSSPNPLHYNLKNDDWKRWNIGSKPKFWKIILQHWIAN